MGAGLSFDTKDSEGNIISEALKLTKVQYEFFDIGEKVVDGALTVSYGDYKAVKGEKGYLLLTGGEYTYTATPANTKDYTTGTKTETLAPNDGIYTVKVEVPLNKPVTITAPTGAKAQLYDFVQYYKNPEYPSYGVKDNGDGTSTTYFVGTSMGAGGSDGLLYRVTYKDYIVKAGWLSGSDYENRKPIVVTFSENDLKKDARIDYAESNDTNKTVAEDGVFLNINGQNNLVMSVGNKPITLKAYRVWEIIPYMTQNWIITPDFNYDIISGNKALAKLSAMQLDDGSFESIDGKNTESIAQVIVALTSLGINPEEDTKFIKKGMSPVDALCGFAVEGGGFMHTPDTNIDGMATEQGYYALVSYFRMLNSETGLYDMSDVTLKTGKYNDKVASAYDEQSAKEVDKLIDKIGTVTINSGKRIKEANIF